MTKPVTNAEVAAAFRAVKPVLEGGYTFICTSLKELERRQTIRRAACNRATSVVYHRLEGRKTVECWLFAQKHISHSFRDQDYTWCAQQLREYRLRWLDALAAEFDRPGVFKSPRRGA